MARDLFGARASLPGHPDLFRINRLDETGAADTQRLPHTVRILLEGLLRNAGGLHVREEDVLALAAWPAAPGDGKRVPFFPARVLLQDFTGVPAVVDLAAMRAAMARAGRDPNRVDPLVPCDLVIDHSETSTGIAAPAGSYVSHVTAVSSVGTLELSAPFTLRS